MAGSLVANLVLSKSLLWSQGGLTDVYVRVLRIESESSLIRNLNHVNAVHVRSAGRVRASNPAAPSHVWTSSKSTRLKPRSEEHTSELQSHLNLVCRLLLEKKKP